jgi:hypothetical protein
MSTLAATLIEENSTTEWRSNVRRVTIYKTD